MSQKFHYIQELHHKTVEKDILDGFQDINTREELMQMGRDEGLEGEIVRWDVWDRVVQQAKADIEALGYLPPVTLKKECYVYSTVTGKLIGRYDSMREAAQATGIPDGTVQHCCWKHIPLQRADLVFSNTPLTHKEVVEHYCKKGKFNGGLSKPRWVYRESDGKFLGEFPDSKSVADKFGITPASVNYYVFKEKPYHLHNLIIRDRPMTPDETE